MVIFYVIYKVLKHQHKCCFKEKIIDNTQRNETLQERIERENRIARPANPEQKSSTLQRRPPFKRIVNQTIQKNRTIRMLSKHNTQNKKPQSAGLLLLQEDIKQPPLPVGEPPPPAGEEKQQNTQSLSTVVKQVQPIQRIRQKIQQKHRNRNNTQQQASNNQNQPTDNNNKPKDKHIVEIKNE